MQRLFRLLWLFTLGGALWVSIEVLYRGWSHPTMFFVGGLCFVLIGKIHEIREIRNTSILLQGVIASVVVLVIEFTSGLVLNLWLGLDIWDYSSHPFNFLGQICLDMACNWYVMSIVGIVLSDYLKYRLFGAARPRYRILMPNNKMTPNQGSVSYTKPDQD